MLRALRASKGSAIAVTDEELSGAQARLAEEGMDASPEGGATSAALAHLVGQKEIGPEDSVVLFNTGGALKYLEVL